MAGQNITCLMFCAAGAAAGPLYEVFRRLARRSKRPALVSAALDMLFCFICAVGMFFIALFRGGMRGWWAIFFVICFILSLFILRLLKKCLTSGIKKANI